MKLFWNNGWKFPKSTKRRKYWHFPETPGIKPRLDQYSHGGQRGKTLLAWARRLGHKYVNTFPVEAGGLHHRVISCRVFWIMILPASLVLETTMTYSFGTSSQPLHHAVNAYKKVNNCAEFGRPSKSTLDFRPSGLGEERRETRHAWRPLLGLPWASQPQTMANTQGFDCWIDGDLCMTPWVIRRIIVGHTSMVRLRLEYILIKEKYCLTI